MKFGMVGCEVRKKTVMARSFVDGIWLTSTKLGASGFLPGGESALV